MIQNSSPKRRQHRKKAGQREHDVEWLLLRSKESHFRSEDTCISGKETNVSGKEAYISGGKDTSTALSFIILRICDQARIQGKEMCIPGGKKTPTAPKCVTRTLESPSLDQTI